MYLFFGVVWIIMYSEQLPYVQSFTTQLNHPILFVRKPVNQNRLILSLTLLYVRHYLVLFTLLCTPILLEHFSQHLYLLSFLTRCSPKRAYVKVTQSNTVVLEGNYEYNIVQPKTLSFLIFLTVSLFCLFP